MAFNTAQVALFVGAGALTFRTIAGSQLQWNSGSTWVAMVATSVVMTVVNGLLISTLSTIDRGPGAYSAWLRRRRQDSFEFPGNYIIGAIAAAAISVSPWLLLLFGVVLAQVYRALNQTRFLSMSDELNRQLRRNLAIRDTLETTADYASRLMDSSVSLVYLLNETKSAATLRAQSRAADETGIPTQLDLSQMKRLSVILDEGKSLEFHYPSEIGDQFNLGAVKLAGVHPIRRGWLIPLVGKDGLLAFVVTATHGRQRFTFDLFNHAGRLADLVTPAISHALAYNRSVIQQRFLSALAEFSQTWLLIDDLDELAEAARSAADELLGVSAVICWDSHDPDGDHPPLSEKSMTLPLSLRPGAPLSLDITFDHLPEPSEIERSGLLGRQASSAVERLLDKQSSLDDVADLGRLAGLDKPMEAIAGTLLQRIARQFPGSRLALVAMEDVERRWEPLAHHEGKELVHPSTLVRIPRPDILELHPTLVSQPDGQGGTMFILPLMTESKIRGALIVCGVEAHTGRAALLSAFGGPLSLVFGNAQLTILRQEAALREDRERIAAELHDGVTQTVTGAKLSAEFVRDKFFVDPDTAFSKTNWLCDQLAKGVDESRGVITALRPATPNNGSLLQSIRDIIDTYREIGTVTIMQPIYNVRSELPSELEGVAYRIIREAIVNANKHAIGATVRVTVVEHDKVLRIAVTDNGPGFTPMTESPEGHMGMTLLHKRAAELGGETQIISEPGRGAEVRVTIPIPEIEEDDLRPISGATSVEPLVFIDESNTEIDFAGLDLGDLDHDLTDEEIDSALDADTDPQSGASVPATMAA